MSRYSPQGYVPNHSGDIIANAITNALSGYGEAKRRGRFEQQATDDRTRNQAIQNVGLGEQGIHLLKPGEAAPTPLSGEVNQTLAAALNPSVGAAPVAAPTPRITPGDGYYINNDERAAHARQAADLSFAAKMREALGTAQIDETVHPGERALKNALTNSEITKNLREPERNIDPLSPQGLTASGQKERVQSDLALQRESALIRLRKSMGLGADGLPIPKASDGERKNAAFQDIAKAESPTLDKMGATVVSSTLGRIPLVGNMILEHTDPAFQSQQNAGDRWIMQWLRSTSGAAIGKDELSNYRKQYIPQAGDTPQTVGEKTAARKRVEAALGTMAGPAASRPPGGGRGVVQPQRGNAPPGNVTLGGDTALHPAVQTIDALIKAGKSDAEIRAALGRP